MLRLSVSLVCLASLPGTADSQHPSAPNALMCIPGELLFFESFDPETVSERWGFKADFALRDGALLRTNVNPGESKRVFLKEASFHDTIIQFDFRFSGKTTDLRLVTGSGGGYNSITQIRPAYFQVNTPIDRDAGILPAHLGECVCEPRRNQWHTMTVEYWNDEVLAHLGKNEFVFGRHPIIDRNRRYFAFQFDYPGASIDNVRVWTSHGQRTDWSRTRDRLTMTQSRRPPAPRDPESRYRYEYTNLKSRLNLHDPAYRALVAKHDKLQAALHADYPEAFITHKQLSKRIANQKQHLRTTSPEFKAMEAAVHKARRAEDDYTLSTEPELAKLKEDGIARQRYVSELGQVRARLEATGDRQLAALVAETARRQAELEARFPAGFESVDTAVSKRKAIRNALNDDAEFQTRNRSVVDAGRAVKDYELQAEPGLAKLAARSKGPVESDTSSGATDVD